MFLLKLTLDDERRLNIPYGQVVAFLEQENKQTRVFTTLANGVWTVQETIEEIDAMVDKGLAAKAG